MDKEKEKYIEQTLNDFIHELSLIERMSEVLFTMVQRIPKRQKHCKNIIDNTEVLSRVISYFKLRLLKFHSQIVKKEISTLTNPAHSFGSSSHSS